MMTRNEGIQYARSILHRGHALMRPGSLNDEFLALIIDAHAMGDVYIPLMLAINALKYTNHNNLDALNIERLYTDVEQYVSACRNEYYTRRGYPVHALHHPTKRTIQ